MPEQIVAETKEEAVALCVSHFRSYELLAFNSSESNDTTDKYSGICISLLKQYAQLTGHTDLLAAHKSFSTPH